MLVVTCIDLNLVAQSLFTAATGPGQTVSLSAAAKSAKIRHPTLRKPKVAMNITLTVPEGSTTHGTPYLLCKPPEWHDYIVFFFANYVAHAATVILLPGQGFWETFLSAITALLVTSSGIVRAIDVVFQHPIFRK
ncbi:hypothetical protein BJX62DRAFT_12938 [Aspergillus germanicus]